MQLKSVSKLKATRGYLESPNTSVLSNMISQRKLKEALKKDGLQLSGGKIFPLDAETPPTKNKRKKIDGDEDDTEATPNKKKGAKGKVKDQQDDSDEVA